MTHTALRRAARRRDLRGVIEAAADPRQRAEARWCRPVATPPEVVADRLDRWVGAVTSGDRGAFDRLLARRGLDPDRADERLVDVEVRPGAVLPDWASALEHLLDDATGGTGAGGPGRRSGAGHDVDDQPWTDGLDLFRSPAGDHVRGAAAEAGVVVTRGATAGLVDGLHRRLGQVADPALDAPPHVAGADTSLVGLVDRPVRDLFLAGGVDGADPAAWLEVFQLYPVLARALGVTWIHWRDAVTDLLNDLARDRRAIADAWADGDDLGSLEDVRLDVGDRHGRGRAVAMLAFSTGVRVLHKPRELRIAADFHRLLARLADHPDAPVPGLTSRTILVRDRHAWEQQVHDAGCADRGAVGRFYVRLGMLARLLVTLGGHDLTLDNVRVAGEHPVVVDLETLFRPLPRTLADRAPDDGGAHATWWNSPAPTGLFTCHVDDPLAGGASASPLSPLDEAVAAASAVTGDRPPGAVAGADQAPWLPSLRGQSVDPRDFHDDVASGYAAMGSWLHVHAGWLAGPDGPLEAMAGCTVRFLHRSSEVYQRLLDRSLEPASLGDGVSREIVLERAWRTLEVDPDALPLVEAEIDDLRRLDIPLLRARSDSDSVVLPDGHEVPLFRGTGLGRARAALSAEPGRSNEAQEEEIALVGSLLHCLDPRPRPPGSADPVALVPDRHPGPDHGRSLDAAVRIAHQIRRHALQAGPGIGWIGVELDPVGAHLDITPLAPDLLNGTAGLAVVLAEVGRLAEDRGLTTFANDLATLLVGRLPDRPGPHGALGGLVGPGSLLHGLARVARTVEDPRLLAAVSAAASRLDPARLPDPPAPGLVVGRSGLALNLLSVHASGAGDRNLLDRVEAILVGGHTPYTRDPPDQAEPPDPTDWPTRWVADELPPPGLALLMARRRLAQARRTGAAGTPPAISPHSPREPGSRRPPRRGVLLARMALTTTAGTSGDQQLAQDVDTHLRPDVATTTDLLGRLEVAVSAIERLDPDRYRPLAHALAARLLERSVGSWFPELRLADHHNLSALHGLGALALALARLADPGPPRSLRLLD